MTDPSSGRVGKRTLPDRPHLEHLKNEAKRRLLATRATLADAKLADVQFALAREYGFASWRALKAEVEQSDGSPRSLYARYVGFYASDPETVGNGGGTVSEADGRLYWQGVAEPKMELQPRIDGFFALPGVDNGLTFEGGHEGRAQQIAFHTNGRQIVMNRDHPDKATWLQEAYEKDLADQIRPRTAIDLPVETLDRYVGWYALATGPVLNISREGAQLFIQGPSQGRSPLYPETETEFFMRPPVQVSFRLRDGRVESAQIRQNGRRHHLAPVSTSEAETRNRVIDAKFEEERRPRTMVKIDPGWLELYVGRYELDARTVMAITAEGGRLFTQLTGQARFELYPESEHSFFLTVVAAQTTFLIENGAAAYAILRQNGAETIAVRMPSDQ